MKLYIVYAYGPDMYEHDDALFGVFNSKEKCMQALKDFGDGNDFDFSKEAYEIREVTLNEAIV